MSTLFIANVSFHHEADLRCRLPRRGLIPIKIGRNCQTSVTDTHENLTIIVNQLRALGVIKVGEPLPRRFPGLYYSIDQEIDVGSLGTFRSREQPMSWLDPLAVKS
jgi:hypothetical protein